jgi:Mor family transcriptional regulator
MSASAANDLVSDILERIAEKHAKLPAKVAKQIEEDIRRDWGGERHYIAKVGETGRAQLAERDALIRAQARRGDHVKLLARRWGISEKRVRQILAVVETTVAVRAQPAANDDAG